MVSPTVLIINVLPLCSKFILHCVICKKDLGPLLFLCHLACVFKYFFGCYYKWKCFLNFLFRVLIANVSLHVLYFLLKLRHLEHYNVVPLEI